MAMGFTMANAHPHSGIRSSSRLISVVCGATSVCVQSVSQLLWCLTRKMQGTVGMCSRPDTCQRIPHVAASQNKAGRVHPPMMNS